MSGILIDPLFRFGLCRLSCCAHRGPPVCAGIMDPAVHAPEGFLAIRLGSVRSRLVNELGFRDESGDNGFAGDPDTDLRLPNCRHRLYFPPATLELVTTRCEPKPCLISQTSA